MRQNKKTQPYLQSGYHSFKLKTWTSLKKRKQRRRNENSSMIEEAKVRQANEAIAIV